MNTQFKRGVLELVVLLTIKKEDMYGYQLVNEVNTVISVNEGTIYPLLRRLTNEKYFETYLRESNEGPPRKYYRLSVAGLNYTEELLSEWKSFVESVNTFIKEGHNE
ncbi:MAG: PadR family transcriptional regulator [Erysipelothrix sp.]|nr:PadR family transcriptional regulator [Erysipelothrix sp.]